MPKSDEFLRDYLKDVRASMEERRQFEQRLVQYLLVFYPVLVSAFVSLYQTDIARMTYIMIVIGGGVFVLLVCLSITQRILVEHRAYALMGSTVQKIWGYFGLFDAGAYLEGQAVLPESVRDPEQGYGQGKGYRRTLLFIWLITLAVLAMLGALGWTKP